MLEISVKKTESCTLEKPSAIAKKLRPLKIVTTVAYKSGKIINIQLVSVSPPYYYGILEKQQDN